MRIDLITQIVPEADPTFLRIIEQLPDPSPDAYEQVVSVLPALHQLFLRKRAAAERGDDMGFAAAVDEEVRLLDGLM